MKYQRLGSDTCLLDSYAMCMGYDPMDLVAAGAPQVDGHPEEYIPICVSLGYAPVYCSLFPRKDTCVSSTNPMGSIFTKEEAHYRLNSLILHNNAVFILGRHAVAWSYKEEKIYDPRGTKHELKDILHRIRGYILFYPS